MSIKPKEIIIIAALPVISFPVLYFVALLLTNNARIEFGPPKTEAGLENLKTVKPSATRDSLIAQYSRTFQAMQQERVQLEDERNQLNEARTRIQLQQSELEAQQNKLVEERKKFETAVAQNKDAELKRIKQLSKVYGAMRPQEAAQILETLDDALAMQIIMSMGDDRQKAKIFAALSKDKATRISAKMGK